MFCSGSGVLGLLWFVVAHSGYRMLIMWVIFGWVHCICCIDLLQLSCELFSGEFSVFVVINYCLCFVVGVECWVYFNFLIVHSGYWMLIM